MANGTESDFPSANAVYAQTMIEEERGRWVVYLEVGFWDPNEIDSLHTVRRRIQDYAKKSQAEIAARWIERTARKEQRHPPSGSPE